jgi:hypothetical protein
MVFHIQVEDHAVFDGRKKFLYVLIDFPFVIRNNKCKTKQAGAQVWKRG